MSIYTIYITVLAALRLYAVHLENESLPPYLRGAFVSRHARRRESHVLADTNRRQACQD